MVRIGGRPSREESKLPLRKVLLVEQPVSAAGLIVAPSSAVRACGAVCRVLWSCATLLDKRRYGDFLELFDSLGPSLLRQFGFQSWSISQRFVSGCCLQNRILPPDNSFILRLVLAPPENDADKRRRVGPSTGELIVAAEVYIVPDDGVKTSEAAVIDKSQKRGAKL